MSSGGTFIAVVDDEAAVRSMLTRVLRFAHYQVESYANGEAFLASLGSRVPACAVLDIHMAGLSGFDVQRRIHQTGARIPIVMITASDEVSLQHQAQSAGAIRLLRKPFSSDELLEAVKAAVGDDTRTSVANPP